MLLCLFLLASIVAKSCQLNSTACGENYRRPEPTDISVECGTSSINLAILICPVIYTGYNASLLILNYINDDPTCAATLDESVTPPVARFTFPINTTKACGSTFMTTNSAGTGAFVDFSNIQTVHMSGAVRSYDPTTGVVSYNAELKYFYSCSYPLEYLINNTLIEVSASSIAVKDNNGSFISTLSMGLYEDISYTTPLVVPPMGLELRTKVFVQVKAENLTDQYHILLDRCYATTSPQPMNSTFFNLFVTCSQDQMTTMHENGVSQYARFSFPAFRFVEQQNQSVSTYYLHCITRLCEISTCSNFMQCSKRRKRDASSAPEAMTLSSSIPIITRNDNDVSSSGSRMGLGIVVGVLTVVVIVAGAASTILYRRLRRL
ncbi:zona pellucida-like domain-containing protein 1 [Genypterus blacodes]|uniref:zona pellucida-like domain-containing protein 1 n=1 Tax=Genypterus blacodes TaxID=154954 RepID=UPI003F776620